MPRMRQDRGFDGIGAGTRKPCRSGNSLRRRRRLHRHRRSGLRVRRFGKAGPASRRGAICNPVCRGHGKRHRGCRPPLFPDARAEIRIAAGVQDSSQSEPDRFETTESAADRDSPGTGGHPFKIRAGIGFVVCAGDGRRVRIRSGSAASGCHIVRGGDSRSRFRRVCRGSSRRRSRGVPGCSQTRRPRGDDCAIGMPSSRNRMSPRSPVGAPVAKPRKSDPIRH